MQAEMNKLFAEGGVMQQGGTVDPVSGNDVPPGAMAEEVRDDIPAQLSEGEFVMPADVVRYWGLEKLMAMRDKAKMGLKKMEEIGQMGNAEEVPDGEALHGGEDEMDEESFSSEIDSILGEEGGEEERGYKDGGYVVPENAQLYSNAPLRGFEMVAMTNAAGNVIYIPHVNGEPQLTVPTGYSVRKSPIQNAPTTPTDGGVTTGGVGSSTGLLESGGYGGGEADGGGGGSGGGTPSGPASSGISMTAEGTAVANTVSTTAATVAGMVASAVTGIPGLSMVANSIANTMNFNAAQAAMNVNVATADTTNPANEAVTDAPTATAGPTGTGGSAASAASAAASAAAAAGHSDAAIGAASQAAATATVGGASPAAAAAAAADAANAAAADAADAEGSGVGTAATAAAADAAAAAGVAAADGVGADGPGTGTGAGVGGTAAGDAAAGTAAADGVGADGPGTGTGAGVGGTAAGDGDGDGDGDGEGEGEGEGYAKGGFVNKRKTQKVIQKKKGLASRR